MRIAADAQRQVTDNGVAHKRRPDRNRRLRQVHNLASDSGEAAVQLAVDHDARTESFVEHQQGEAGEITANTAGELGESREIDVIFDPHGAVQRRGQRRPEPATVRAEIITNSAVCRDDSWRSDDNKLHGTLSDLREVAALIHQLDDVIDPVVFCRELCVLLCTHRSAGVDENYMCGAMVNVHRGGEPQTGVQPHPRGRWPPSVMVNAIGGNRSCVLQHPQHLRDGCA